MSKKIKNCVICGKEFEIETDFGRGRPPTTCSEKCKKERSKQIKREWKRKQSKNPEINEKFRIEHAHRNAKNKLEKTKNIGHHNENLYALLEKEFACDNCGEKFKTIYKQVHTPNFTNIVKQNVNDEGKPICPNCGLVLPYKPTYLSGKKSIIYNEDKDPYKGVIFTPFWIDKDIVTRSPTYEKDKELVKQNNPYIYEIDGKPSIDKTKEDKEKRINERIIELAEYYRKLPKAHKIHFEKLYPYRKNAKNSSDILPRIKAYILEKYNEDWKHGVDKNKDSKTFNKEEREREKLWEQTGKNIFGNVKLTKKEFQKKMQRWVKITKDIEE